MPMFELIPAVIGAGAPDSRTRLAGAALHRQGLMRGLQSVLRWGRPVVARPVRSVSIEQTSMRLQVVEAFSRRLAHRVSECLLAGDLPLVIGGDHSCAVGTWSGVAAITGAGRLGLLWIDAHLDAHTPGSSPSQMPHGMPLAILLGEGPSGLTRLSGLAPVLDARRVVVLGARSWEPAEAARLARLGVRVMTAQEVRDRGLSVCLREALAQVRGAPGQVWGMSLDVDALDPRELPATGTPVPGGLSVSALGLGLAGIGRAEGLMGIEVAEYNPRLDADCRTATRLVGLMSAMLL
jgi:arginase